jgi:hypothetical protein
MIAKRRSFLYNIIHAQRSTDTRSQAEPHRYASAGAACCRPTQARQAARSQPLRGCSSLPGSGSLRGACIRSRAAERRGTECRPTQAQVTSPDRGGAQDHRRALHRLGPGARTEAVAHKATQSQPLSEGVNHPPSHGAQPRHALTRHRTGNQGVSQVGSGRDRVSWGILRVHSRGQRPLPARPEQCRARSGPVDGAGPAGAMDGSRSVSRPQPLGKLLRSFPQVLGKRLRRFPHRPQALRLLTLKEGRAEISGDTMLPMEVPRSGQ